MNQVKSIIEPDLTDVLVNFKLDVFSTLNCVKVGQISSYNATKKTAQVQILFKRILPDDSIVSYKPLIDCPVFTLQGGGGAIQFPVAAGDQCLLLFSDRRLDEWLQNGAQAAPGDGRMHDLSDAICLVGLNALNSALAANPTNKVVILYHNQVLNLTQTGLQLISSGTGEVDIDTKITIKNGTTTLFTLLGTFLTMLEALTIADDEGGAILPLTAASIAAIEAFRTQFGALLG